MSNQRKAAQISSIALTLVLILSNLPGRKTSHKMTFSDLLDVPEISQTTVLDEVEDNVLIYQSKTDLLEMADYLEEGIEILKRTKRFQLSDSQNISLPDSVKADIIRLASLGEVKSLIEDADHIILTKDQRKRKEESLKQLGIIYSCYEDWFKNQGIDNVTKLMEDILKGSISAETGVPMDQIGVPVRDNKTGNFTIQVGDKVFELYGEPEHFNMVGVYEEIKGQEQFQLGKAISTCKMALAFAKTALAAGANVRNDTIQAQYTSKYIQSEFGLK